MKEQQIFQLTKYFCQFILLNWFSVVPFYKSCDQAGIHMFIVNDIYTRTRCEICSKLTIKTPYPNVLRCLSLPFVLVFLLLTLNITAKNTVISPNFTKFPHKEIR